MYEGKQPKADKLLKMQRVRQVQEWMLEGYLTPDIIKSCMAKWNIKEPMAFRYIREARQGFQAIRIKELEDRIAFHIAARLKLYNGLEGKTKSNGASVALEILKDIAKVEGVYVERVEQTNTHTNINYNIELTPEEAQTIAKALEDEC